MTSLIPGAQTLIGTEDTTEEDRFKEDQHFATVICAFARYEQIGFQEVDIQREYYASVNQKYKDMLPDHYKRFVAVKEGIMFNYDLISYILGPHLDDNYHHVKDTTIDEQQILSKRPRVLPLILPPSQKHAPRVGPEEMEKVYSTLKQFVRDWSAEGAFERDKCYGPLLAELEQLFPTNRGQIKVLTPGAGLGRLSWEIANRGFCSQGNEFSFYMLLAANFMLNYVKEKEQIALYPFVHQRSNNFNQSDPLRSVAIPDVNPADLPPNSDFTMVAGDFVELYNATPNHWDCIVTCFFLDTARNVFEYIEVIHRALKKGGVWINLGPLLYHYAESFDTFSIELSYDELKKVITDMGFEITKDSIQSCTYTTNKRSMIALVYKCAMFTAVKKTDNPKTDVLLNMHDFHASHTQPFEHDHHHHENGVCHH
jgi:carnosine N-methyltransferase